MADVRLSIHARDMLAERAIPDEWLQRTIDDPEVTEEVQDGTIHYFRAMPEHGGRVLHVVVNPSTNPATVVTLFFDRRARR